MNTTTYLVTFTSNKRADGDLRGTVDVTVREEEPGLFSATNLEHWGMGKNARTPEAAIRMLVQDQATIHHIERAA